MVLDLLTKVHLLPSRSKTGQRRLLEKLFFRLVAGVRRRWWWADNPIEGQSGVRCPPLLREVPNTHSDPPNLEPSSVAPSNPIQSFSNVRVLFTTARCPTTPALTGIHPNRKTKPIQYWNFLKKENLHNYSHRIRDSICCQRLPENGDRREEKER